MIRRRVFESCGESFGGETEGNRCPGENNCSMFKVAKSETNDGEEACRGCELLPTKGKTIVPNSRCVGETACGWFAKAAGNTREEKAANACGDSEKPICIFLKSKPQRSAEIVEIETANPAEVEKLVSEIADFIFWEDAGSPTDWTLYPFEYRMLYGIWREAEKQVTRIQQGRMQIFIKSFWGKE